jgi:Ricin-type beta-trefoil lectin domain
VKKRVTIYSLCATAMTVGGLVLGATPASATIRNTPGYVHLMNSGSGKCIDATDSGAVQWRCLNTFNEEWQFVDINGGFVLEVVSHASGECLTREEDSAANGTPVVLAPCAPADHPLLTQSWLPSSDPSSSHFQLISWGFEKCLDLENGNTSDGVPMQVWDCNDNTNNQRWQQI